MFRSEQGEAEELVQKTATIERQCAESPVEAHCLFCNYNDSAKNLVLFEWDSFYVRFDNFPAARGHVEIVPKKHVSSFFDLSPDEVAEAYKLMSDVKNRLDRVYRPDGYSIGINDGPASGQSIPHLHIHLIPRHQGDMIDPRAGIRRGLPNGDPDEWRLDPKALPGPAEVSSLQL